jgi:lysophospholipase L1-like esterase
MVWPSRQYYNTFDAVIKNHEDAAAMSNALLAPVGLVWKTHFDSTQDFSYYGADNFHPSLKGSQVAAEDIVESLF